MKGLDFHLLFKIESEDYGKDICNMYMYSANGTHNNIGKYVVRMNIEFDQAALVDDIVHSDQ